MEKQDNLELAKRVGVIKLIIAQAPQTILAAQERTHQPWLICFKDPLFAVETHVTSPRFEKLMPGPPYADVLYLINIVKERVLQLETEYAGRLHEISVEVRAELLLSLKKIGNQL